MANAKVITRMLRYFSGQAKADRESLSKIKGELAGIHERKQEALAAFERDRKARLEALVKEQARAESPAPPPQKSQEEKRQEIRERRSEPARRPAADSQNKQAPPPATAQGKAAPSDYEARRRAFFRQRAVKQRQEQSPRKERLKSQDQGRKTGPDQAPLPSRDFNAADGRAPESDRFERPANDFDRAAGSGRERPRTNRPNARNRDRGGGPDREM